MYLRTGLVLLQLHALASPLSESFEAYVGHDHINNKRDKKYKSLLENDGQYRGHSIQVKVCAPNCGIFEADR